jgi:hypothetical protein
MARDITIARFIPRILQLVNNGKQDILFQNSFPFKVSWFQLMIYSNSIKKRRKNEELRIKSCKNSASIKNVDNLKVKKIHNRVT